MSLRREHQPRRPREARGPSSERAPSRTPTAEIITTEPKDSVTLDPPPQYEAVTHSAVPTEHTPGDNFDIDLERAQSRTISPRTSAKNCLYNRYTRIVGWTVYALAVIAILTGALVLLISYINGHVPRDMEHPKFVAPVRHE